ncbi:MULTISPECIES: hypothetical protein [Vibrio harveyi group]|uniref:hypothetical protein n=1 Tax=Vibrio harveyi group TaxID=717610 RepID=UPI00193D8D74|nr:hypothetical protein [Vibrio parahaemolyticus]HDY7720036.1 hypothetical protein [Vibrio vulnificus]HDY7747342.1 hypothetical protein [Vibrio vulnificus]HDY7757283.1 hypothetical protein [Vibrio vulnificus]HDY7763222.1 hypothetical protein [Vibrio vulnificus]
MQGNKNTIVSTGDELELFLRGKGIALNDVKTSIRTGIAAYNDTTSNYPATFRGHTISAITNVSLRELLGYQGYEKDSPNNIELTVNKENGFGIHVVRGDAQTGLLSGYPATLRKKGELSLDFFGLKTSEHGQIDMFAEELPTYGSPKCPYDVWFLMLYTSFDGDNLRVRSELSKPIFCSQKGFVNGFSRRYLIDMTDYGDSLIIEPDHISDEGFSEDIEINISMNE